MTRQDKIRFTLERLDRWFPNQELLGITEVANFLGNSRTTVYKYLPRTPEGKISKEDLADYLVQERV